MDFTTFVAIFDKTMKQERIAILRQLMQEEHLSALIISGRYAHGEAYVPERWAAIEWLTGVKKQSATVVVTLDKIAFWTDAATREHLSILLTDVNVELLTDEVAGTPTVSEWIGRELANVERAEVGIDGMQNAASTVEEFVIGLRNAGGITLRTNVELLQRIWKDRPVVADGVVTMLPSTDIEVSVTERLAQVRHALRIKHADGMLVSSAGNIAWVLNIDPACVYENKVLDAYLLIDSQKATLYTRKETLAAEVQASLAEAGIVMDDYTHVRKGLQNYFEYNILMDPEETSYTLYHSSMREIVSTSSPIPVLRRGGEVKDEMFDSAASVAPTTPQEPAKPKYVYQPKRPSGCLEALGWVLLLIGGMMIGLGIFGLFVESGNDAPDTEDSALVMEPADSLATTDSAFVMQEEATAVVDTVADTPVETMVIDSITGDTTWIVDDTDMSWNQPYRESARSAVVYGIAILLILFGLVPFVPGLVILLVYYQNKKRYRKWCKEQGLLP